MKTIKETQMYKPIETKNQSEDDFELEIEVLDTDTTEVEDIKDPAPEVEEVKQPEVKDPPKQVKTNTDDKKYSNRTEKRIRELNAKAKTYEDMVRERDEEIARLKAEYTNTTKQSKESLKTSLEAQMKTLNSQFIAAMEAGESTQVSEIQDQLMDTKMRLASISYELENTKEVKEPVKPKVEPKQTSKEVPQKALDWIEEHPEFNTDPIFYGAALTVNNILISEGYDPDDDSFYDEINARLSKRFPDIFDKNIENDVKSSGKENISSEETLKTKEKVEQTVSGASRTPSTSINGKPQVTSKTKVTLTQEDIRLAEKWGMSKEKFARRKLLLEGRQPSEYSPIFVDDKK